MEGKQRDQLSGYCENPDKDDDGFHQGDGSRSGKKGSDSGYIL